MRFFLGGGHSSGSCLLTALERPRQYCYARSLPFPRRAQAIPLCKKPACSQKGPAVAETSSLWVESVQQGAE